MGSAQFQRIATLLAGDSAPVWLVEHLERWQPALMLDLAVGERQPKRREMLQQLSEVRAAATALHAALSSTPIVSMLDLPHVRVEPLRQELRDIAEKAARAAASSDLVAGDGKPKPGAPRLDSKLLCAAVMAETWTFFHGSEPAPRNRVVAEAAAEYWNLAGGKSKGWGDDPLNGWKTWFARVKDQSVASIRDECRRHLVEMSSRNNSGN